MKKFKQIQKFGVEQVKTKDDVNYDSLKKGYQSFIESVIKENKIREATMYTPCWFKEQKKSSGLKELKESVNRMQSEKLPIISKMKKKDKIIRPSSSTGNIKDSHMKNTSNQINVNRPLSAIKLPSIKEEPLTEENQNASNNKLSADVLRPESAPIFSDSARRNLKLIGNSADLIVQKYEPI